MGQTMVSLKWLSGADLEWSVCLKNHIALLDSHYLVTEDVILYSWPLETRKPQCLWSPVSSVRGQCWPLTRLEGTMEEFRAESEVSMREDGKNIRTKNKDRKSLTSHWEEVCPLINCLIYYQWVAAPAPQSSITPLHPRPVWCCSQHQC